MASTIVAKEVITYTAQGAADEAGVYKLQVGEIDLGYLYLAIDTYTITWPATKDFEFRHVADYAYSFLGRQLDSIKPYVNNREIDYVTNVTFVTLNGLRRFVLDRSDAREYYAILSEPDSIAFARYDFEVESLSATYSFSAENPDVESFDDRELAILLPRHQPMAKGLLNWIVSAHILSRDLRHILDQYHAYHDLMKVIDSYPTGRTKR